MGFDGIDPFAGPPGPELGFDGIDPFAGPPGFPLELLDEESELPLGPLDEDAVELDPAESDALDWPFEPLSPEVLDDRSPESSDEFSTGVAVTRGAGRPVSRIFRRVLDRSGVGGDEGALARFDIGGIPIRIGTRLGGRGATAHGHRIGIQSEVPR